MKLRKTGGKRHKATARLNGRIADWENILKSGSDISRKHPKGFRKPGRG